MLFKSSFPKNSVRKILTLFSLRKFNKDFNVKVRRADSREMKMKPHQFAAISILFSNDEYMNQ